MYRQLQRLIQERTRVQTATEIDTGEDNCAGSCRELILERATVQTAKEIDTREGKCTDNYRD